MIKRVLGIGFTLIVIATIIFASLEWGNYSSMVFNFESREQGEELVEESSNEFADEELAEDAEIINGELMINGTADETELIDGEDMINGTADSEAL